MFKLLADLLEYYELNCMELYGEDKYKTQYERCRKIMDRELRSAIKIDTPAIACVDRDYINDIAARANRDVDNGEFDSAIIKSGTYTGKPNKYQSALVLTDSDGGILAKNKDYTAEAYYMGKTVLDKKSTPKEGAEITVIIKGKGNYTGTIETSYSVKGIDFSKADIKVRAKRYTGSSVIIKS